VFLFIPIRATWPAYLILLGLIILITLSEEYKSRSSSLCGFLHPLVTSALFGPNILLSILFQNTLSLYSSLNVRDQVSHPYRTTGKMLVLYTCIAYKHVKLLQFPWHHSRMLLKHSYIIQKRLHITLSSTLHRDCVVRWRRPSHKQNKNYIRDERQFRISYLLYYSLQDLCLTRMQSAIIRRDRSLSVQLWRNPRN
jgi:hypothetical protein